MSTIKKAGTPKEIAQTYGLNEGTLANLRCNKQGPKYFKQNRKVIYFFEDVEAWLKQNPCLTINSWSCKGGGSHDLV
jgi:hypothetical protein